MKGIFCNKRLILLGMIFCIFSIESVFSFSPTLIFGATVEELIYPETNSTGYLTAIQLNSVFGWRTKLGSGSYLSINGDAVVNSYLYSNPIFSDTENLNLELSVPLGDNRLDIKTGIAGSFLGSGSSSAYANPNWQIKYRVKRGRRKLQPYAAYKGYYLYRDTDSNDLIYQEGKIGFIHRPTIRFGYQASLEGGWQGWLESFLYDSSGGFTQEKRNDLLLKADLQLDGLIGYFLSWQFESSAGLRWSNANRYLTSLSYLEGNSESNWYLYEGGSLNWSPHRKIDLQMGIFGKQEFYIAREALTTGGTLSGDKLKIYSIGLNVRADWTLNDHLFVVTSGSGTWRLSNDLNVEQWNITVSAGIEYSF